MTEPTRAQGASLRRILFLVGLVVLLLTLFSLIAIAARSAPRAVTSSDVQAGNMAPPAAGTPRPTPGLVTAPVTTIPEPNPALGQVIPVVAAMVLGALIALLVQFASSRGRAAVVLLLLALCLVLGVAVAGVGLVLIASLGASLPAGNIQPTPTEFAVGVPPTSTIFFIKFPTPIASTPQATFFPPPGNSTPTSTPSNVQPTSAPVPASSPAPPIVVEAEYPTRMEINREDSIRVTLKQSESRVQVNTPTIEVPGHAGGLSTPIPIGTPGVRLGQALGPGYQACVTAKLDAPAFKVEPAQQPCWSLEQTEITWDWTLINDGTALEPGATGQGITASVEVLWTPNGGGPAIAGELWRSRMEILVDKPLITVGQFNLFSLLTGFVGSGLSVPWIYERWKERRSKKAPLKA